VTISMPRSIYTVGHSTHELEPFIALLTRYGITAVVDVRSQPLSRISHFSRDVLADALFTQNAVYHCSYYDGFSRYRDHRAGQGWHNNRPVGAT